MCQHKLFMYDLEYRNIYQLSVNMWEWITFSLYCESNSASKPKHFTHGWCMYDVSWHTWMRQSKYIPGWCKSAKVIRYRTHMVHGWSKSAYFNYTHEKKTPCMYNIVQSTVILAPLPTSVWHHCDLPLFWCPLLIICYLLMRCCSSFVIFWCPLVIICYLLMPCCYHLLLFDALLLSFLTFSCPAVIINLAAAQNQLYAHNIVNMNTLETIDLNTARE